MRRFWFVLEMASRTWPLNLAKEGLATLRTDVSSPLNDHDILLTVRLVLKIVINVRQWRLALHAREAPRMESPALIEKGLKTE